MGAAATAAQKSSFRLFAMFLNADPVVQGVLIGLVIASIVTWTVWLAKTIEIVRARRRLRMLYQVLLGQEKGPRFGSFVALYGVQNAIDMIDGALARSA